MISIRSKKAAGLSPTVKIWVIVFLGLVILAVVIWGRTETQNALDSISEKGKITQAVDATKQVTSQVKEETSGVWNGIVKYIDIGSNFMFGVPIKQAAKNFFGFQSGWTSLGRFFWPCLPIGLIAGLLMWLGTLGLNSLVNLMNAGIGWSFTKMAPGRTPVGEKIEIRWLGFLSGNLGRVLIIGIAYAALMQISIINRFIELITFYNYTSWLVQPFIIAVYLGYLPSAVEGYIKWREYQKAYRAAMENKVGVAIARAAGRYR